MTNQDIVRKNKRRLLAEKERFEGLLAKMGPEYQDVGNDEDGNAAEVEIFERNLAEGRDLKEQLIKIDGALERIELGTYGVCAVGGEEIARDRLEAAPEADTCVEHAGS